MGGNFEGCEHFSKWKVKVAVMKFRSELDELSGIFRKYRLYGRVRKEFNLDCKNFKREYSKFEGKLNDDSNGKHIFSYDQKYKAWMKQQEEFDVVHSFLRKEEVMLDCDLKGESEGEKSGVGPQLDLSRISDAIAEVKGRGYGRVWRSSRSRNWGKFFKGVKSKLSKKLPERLSERSVSGKELDKFDYKLLYENYRASRRRFVEGEIKKVVASVLSAEVRREVSQELLKRYKGPDVEVFYGSGRWLKVRSKRRDRKSLYDERELLLSELLGIDMSSERDILFEEQLDSMGRIGYVEPIG